MRYRWLRFLLHITAPTTLFSLIIVCITAYLYYKKVISDEITATLLTISLPFLISDRSKNTTKQDIKRAILIEEVIKELRKKFK